MRTRLARGCAILLALFAVSPLRASEGFEDLVNQVRSGTNDAALMAYIDISPVAYDLTVDEILYLSDLGVSVEMIEAAVAHGKKTVRRRAHRNTGAAARARCLGGDDAGRAGNAGG